MKTILTGIRSNSVLTLGNYLGALLPMVRLANKYSKEMNINIFVPDLHSIISDVDGDLKDQEFYYEVCYNEAKKYEYLTDFSKNSQQAYNKAQKKKWIKD